MSERQHKDLFEVFVLLHSSFQTTFDKIAKSVVVFVGSPYYIQVQKGLCMADSTLQLVCFSRPAAYVCRVGSGVVFSTGWASVIFRPMTMQSDYAKSSLKNSSLSVRSHERLLPKRGKLVFLLSEWVHIAFFFYRAGSEKCRS